VPQVAGRLLQARTENELHRIAAGETQRIARKFPDDFVFVRIRRSSRLGTGFIFSALQIHTSHWPWIAAKTIKELLAGCRRTAALGSSKINVLHDKLPQLS